MGPNGPKPAAGGRTADRIQPLVQIRRQRESTPRSKSTPGYHFELQSIHVCSGERLAVRVRLFLYAKCMYFTIKTMLFIQEYSINLGFTAYDTLHVFSSTPTKMFNTN